MLPLVVNSDPESSVDVRLRVPDATEWAALSEPQRQAVEQRIYDALNSGDVLAMSEGTGHFRPKANAYKDLDDHFHRSGRKVFLACELGVLYPGEIAFSPDLLAVADVADPERDRDSWRVVDEGRGIDFILELRNRGQAQKDLVKNVREFARLRIPEYFAFDCRRRVLRGWRLSAGNAVYVPIVPQGGHYPSATLQLELAVVEGRLRFFLGEALVPDSRELIGRLQSMLDEQQHSSEEADRQREEADRQREETDRQREEADRRREETDHRFQQAREQLAAHILARLSARGMSLSEEQRQRVLACDDWNTLMGWLERVQTVPSADDLLS